MKRVFGFISVIALAVVSASCAKVPTETDNEASLRAFESWIHVHYPEVENAKVGNGIYILEDIPGTGETLPKDCYIEHSYLKKDLMTMSILAYTEEEVSFQKYEYDARRFYGPRWTSLIKNDYDTNPATYEIVNGGGAYPRMKVGGKRTVIVPSWIAGSTDIYDTEEEYFKKGSGTKHYLVTIEVTGMTTDIRKYQIQCAKDYMAKMKYPYDDKDTTGFFYTRLKNREQDRGVTVDDEKKLQEDSTYYIEYVGRLLNGKVFDTNIKDTAIKYGLGTRADSYSAFSVSVEDTTSVSLDGNSVIGGFSKTILKMHNFESGVGIFISDYGYGADGSGNNIPPYSPLIFEIDFVKEPED